MGYTIDVFGTGNLKESEARELVRNRISTLITSYADEADVFTELIQNGIDAIEARHQQDGASGELLVIIGRRQNKSHYVYVQDNGVGMSPEVLSKFAVPGFSTGKSQGGTLGYKGVGASYFTGVSKHLSVRTVDPDGTESSLTVRHAYDWVTDSEAPDPLVSEDVQAPEVVKSFMAQISCGTGVFYGLHEGHHPYSLDHTVIVSDGPGQEIRYWAAYLAAKTAIGVVTPEEGAKPKTPITVRIVVDDGDQLHEQSFDRSHYAPNNEAIGYPFPRSVFVSGRDIAQLSALPAAQLAMEVGKHQAVWHRWSAEEFLDLPNLGLDDDQRLLLESHLTFVDGYLASSTDVMKKVKELVGTRGDVVKYGVRLAVDQAPQGRPLELSLTSSQGLDRQTHLVLGFRALDLDTGRKFISNERILDAVRVIGQRVVTSLKDYRPYLKKRMLPEISSNLEKWRQDIEARIGNSTVPSMFGLFDAKSPFEVDPGSENEVIALWIALLTQGLVKGYQTCAISGFNRYDSLVHVLSKAVESDPSDPLAPVSTEAKPVQSAVLEFKHEFGDLILDFHEKVKASNEIDVVVCWDCPELNSDQGALIPTYGKWAHDRFLHSASYRWRNATGETEFQVIALRNVVAELLAGDSSGLGSSPLKVLEARDDAKIV